MTWAKRASQIRHKEGSESSKSKSQSKSQSKSKSKSNGNGKDNGNGNSSTSNNLCLTQHPSTDISTKHRPTRSIRMCLWLTLVT